MKKYGRPQGPDEFLEELNNLQGYLSERSISPRGRFATLQKSLISFRETGRLSNQVAIALRELKQMIAIMNNFPEERDPVFIETLSKATRDSAFPDGGSSKSPGRDHQSELYLAALLASHEGCTIHWEEPDLIVECSNIFFGFAVKRPKSVKKVDGRLRIGAEQLRVNSKHLRFTHGLVAIDTSQISNPNNQFAQRGRRDFTDTAANQLLISPVLQEVTARNLITKHRKEEDGTAFIGALLFGSCIEIVPDGGFINSQSMHFEVLPRFISDLQVLTTALREHSQIHVDPDSLGQLFPRN